MATVTRRMQTQRFLLCTAGTTSSLAIKPLALCGAQHRFGLPKFAWETQSSWDDGAHQED